MAVFKSEIPVSQLPDRNDIPTVKPNIFEVYYHNGNNRNTVRTNFKLKTLYGGLQTGNS